MTEQAWYEDDEFWILAEPVMFGPERVAAATIEVVATLARVHLDEGARALDLGCGIGRHAIELARRGFVVTGVDRTRPYLAHAQRRAEKAGVEVEWVESDMREFVRFEGFDLVINLFSTFGFFQDEEDNLRVAQNACASLKPGGALVVDVVGKEILARRFQKRDWVEAGDTLLLEERTIHPNWERVEARWTLVTKDRRLERTIRLRVYSGSELKALLERAGFQTVHLYGDLAGSAYDYDARRLVAIAHR